MRRVYLAELAKSITRGDCSGALYIIERIGQAQQKTLRLLRTEAEQEVIKLFRGIIVAELEKWSSDDDLRLVIYDPSMIVSDGSVMQYIDVHSVPHCEALLNRMGQHVSIQMAGPVEEFVPRLWAYAVDVSTEDTRCVFFRKYSKSKVVRKSKDAIIWNNGRLSRAGQNLLVIDDQVDCVCIGNQLLVANQMAFETIFDYFDHYTDKAQETIEQLRKTGCFEDPESLKLIGGRDARKLRRIALSCDAMPREILEPNSANKVMEMKDEYGLDICQNPDTGLINIGRSNGWHIVKLLSDDYLASELTQRRYETQSKRRCGS